MSRCVGLAAPAGSGRCPKELSPPRQRRDGESQHGHVHLSPTNTYASPMCGPLSCFILRAVSTRRQCGVPRSRGRAKIGCALADAGGAAACLPQRCSATGRASAATSSMGDRGSSPMQIDAAARRARAESDAVQYAVSMQYRRLGRSVGNLPSMKPLSEGG